MTDLSKDIRDLAGAIENQASTLNHPLAYAAHTSNEMHAKALLILNNAETLVAWTKMQVDSGFATQKEQR